MAKIEYETIQKPLYKRLIEAACIFWEVDVSFFSIKRKDRQTEKRRMLFYLLNKEGDMDYSTIAEYFGYTKQSIAEGIETIDVRKNICLSIARDMAKIKVIATNLEASIIITDIKLSSIKVSV